MAWSFQWRCLRPSGPWCFAVSQVPVRRSFWICVFRAQKVTLDTAACNLELPMALLASLRAMVFCCFASACQEVILDLLWPAASNGAACVPQCPGVLLFRKRLSGAHFALFSYGSEGNVRHRGLLAWSFQRRCLRPSGPWCFAVQTYQAVPKNLFLPGSAAGAAALNQP